MSYLVDASVALSWFTRNERFHPEAVAFLRETYGTLEAPDLILMEVSNGAWKKCRRHELTVEQARACLPSLRDNITTFHLTEELLEQALEIALELDHPIYDCVYLACIERTAHVLVTQDRRLRQKAIDSRFASHVKLLVDLQ